MEKTLKDIISAAETGNNPKLDEILCQLGTDEVDLCLKSTDRNGLTPLLAAVKFDHLETVKLLVEKYGAGLEERGTIWQAENQFTVTGITPLWLSVYENKSEIVNYLLDQSADVNSPIDIGETVIHPACVNRSLATAELLIQHGADIENVGYMGVNVLMGACRRGHKDVAEFLVRKNCQLEKKDWEGRQFVLLVLTQCTWHYFSISLQ